MVMEHACWLHGYLERTYSIDPAYLQLVLREHMVHMLLVKWIPRENTCPCNQQACSDTWIPTSRENTFYRYLQLASFFDNLLLFTFLSTLTNTM